MNDDTFYKIRLDLVHNTINNFVHVMQYDDGVAYIRAEIYKNWQLVHPNSEFDAAQLRIKKPNGGWIKCSTGDPYIQTKKPTYQVAVESGSYYYLSEGSTYIQITNSMTEQAYSELDERDIYKNIGDVISLENDYVKINIVSELTDAYGGCPAVIDFYSSEGHIQTARFVLDVDINPIQQGETVTSVPIDVEYELERLKNTKSSATNLENGSAYDSLKQIDLPYNELVEAIVAGSSYSRLEVIAALAVYGITRDTHNYIYGAGSTTVGIENTTGVQGDNSKGIASFNSGIGNKITGNGCSGNLGGTKNENGGSLSVIAGGNENTIGNENGRNGIIGGEHNELDANDAFVGGGIYNEIWEKASAILGGQHNQIGDAEDANVKARYAVIAGGHTNKIINDPSQNDADFAFVGGGQGNIVQHRNAATLGGYGLKTGWAQQALAGQFNEVVSGALFVIGNGTSDSNRRNALVVYLDGRVSAGTPSNDNDVVRVKELKDSQSVTSVVIIGGSNNSIDIDVIRSVVAGGYTNKIQGTGDLNGFIGGGQGNIIANYKNVGMLGGLGLRARWGNQAIAGAYNELSKGLLIVGDGTSDTARKNAFEVLGHDVLGAGNVGIKIGNTQLTENKLQEIISGGGSATVFHFLGEGD